MIVKQWSMVSPCWKRSTICFDNLAYSWPKDIGRETWRDLFSWLSISRFFTRMLIPVLIEPSGDSFMKHAMDLDSTRVHTLNTVSRLFYGVTKAHSPSYVSNWLKAISMRLEHSWIFQSTYTSQKLEWAICCRTGSQKSSSPWNS